MCIRDRSARGGRLADHAEVLLVGCLCSGSLSSRTSGRLGRPHRRQTSPGAFVSVRLRVGVGQEAPREDGGRRSKAAGEDGRSRGGTEGAKGEHRKVGGDSGARGVRSAADRATATSKGTLEKGLEGRLPIQVSIDVAVPLLVAWDEWMTFDSFTEGVHHIEDVERDGDELIDKKAGPHAVDWRAEVSTSASRKPSPGGRSTDPIAPG